MVRWLRKNPLSSSQITIGMVIEDGPCKMNAIVINNIHSRAVPKINNPNFYRGRNSVWCNVSWSSQEFGMFWQLVMYWLKKSLIWRRIAFFRSEIITAVSFIFVRNIHSLWGPWSGFSVQVLCTSKCVNVSMSFPTHITVWLSLA